MNKSNKNRSALVIGGSGLLGRGVARELCGTGWTVVLLSRGNQMIPKDLENREWLFADRSKEDTLREAVGTRSFDLVIDCAAYSLTDVQVVYGCMRGRVGHYFFIGTDFVHDSADLTNFPLGEDAPKIKGLPYATGKLEAENFLLGNASDEGFPVTILRPPHILGEGRPAGCDPLAGGRDSALPERLRSGEILPLIIGGQFLIQPVWSREVGRIVDHLFARPETFGSILNCAGGEVVTVRRYYQILAECLGVESAFRSVSLEDFIEGDPGKAHIARHRIYSLERLRSLGYQPHLSLREAMVETLGGS